MLEGEEGGAGAPPGSPEVGPARSGGPLGKEIHGLSPEACRHLLADPWPGNVRQLEASVQRAVTLARQPVLQPEDFPLEDLAAADPPGERAGSLAQSIRSAERRYLQEVLLRAGGRRSEAAQILGVSRRTLWKRLKVLGLQ